MVSKKKKKLGGPITSGLTAKGCERVAVPQKVEQRSLAPSSVELSRDAKGVPRWTIKYYAESEDLDQAITEVVRLDRKLRDSLEEEEDG